MEDFEKYVFDPKHPEILKGYKLLTKILKEDNYYVYINPSFMLDFFKDELFTQNTLEEIYSFQKDNLSDLTGTDLAITYIQDYSAKELEELIQKKIDSLDKNPFSYYCYQL